MSEDAARSFAFEVARATRELLGDGLYGAYLGGSLAFGDFVSDRSDVDVALIAERSLTVEEKESLVDALKPLADRCPTRGLELVVYSRAEAAASSWPPRFEVNLNAGPRMPFSVSFDPSVEPAHWFALDLAMLRDRGVPLAGPPPGEAFGGIPRERLLEALVDSFAWHESNEAGSPSTVLNACRAWRFAEEGIWSSKAEAAAWVQSRHGQAAVIDAAIEARRAGEALEPADVGAFVARVRQALTRGHAV